MQSKVDPNHLSPFLGTTCHNMKILEQIDQFETIELVKYL